MRKFISGVIVGAVVGTVAFASSYVADDASFKIFVDGKEFTESKAVVIDGSTYLPLRALGNVLGVSVNWNDELHQVEIGNQEPVADMHEYSRKNPAPIGTIQTYTKESDWYEEDNYTVSIRVLEVVRGDELVEAMKKRKLTYKEAEEGYEYANVKIAFSVISTKGDFSIAPQQSDFTAFTSNNEECPDYWYQAEMVPQLEGQLYEGGDTEGWIAVQIKKDDPAPKIAYGLDYNGTNGIWFALQ